MTASDGNPGRSRVKLGTVALTLNAGGAQCSVTVSQSPATATQTMLLYMPGRDLLKFYKQNIDGVLKAVDANVPGDGRVLVCYQPNAHSQAEMYEAYFNAEKQAAAFALLKSYEITPNAALLLDAYNEQLAQYGGQIMEHRRKFIAELAPIAAKNYSEISHDAEVLQLNYQLCANNTTADALAEKLESVKNAELRAGFCLAGPHREDLEIKLDDQPARVFGSQGQQRSCVLAMKLAEASVVGSLFGEHPVLLLDDVLSELDEGRKQYLLTRMKEKQTFVTSCDDTAFLKTDGEVYRMNGGVLSKA